MGLEDHNVGQERNVAPGCCWNVGHSPHRMRHSEIRASINIITPVVGLAAMPKELQKRWSTSCCCGVTKDGGNEDDRRCFFFLSSTSWHSKHTNGVFFKSARNALYSIGRVSSTQNQHSRCEHLALSHTNCSLRNEPSAPHQHKAQYFIIGFSPRDDRPRQRLELSNCISRKHASQYWREGWLSFG